LISSIEGDKGQFLRAEYATYASIFPQNFVFPIGNSDNGQATQNIVMISLKSAKEPSLHSTDRQLNSYLQNVWDKDIIADMPILTDDFAPVDFLVSKAL
jgi:hypothetical protein